MRKRIYATDAERQRAYRERLRTGADEGSRTTAPPAAPPKVSRPKRLLALQASAQDLADEYQNWLDRLPANLEGSDMASALEKAIEQLQDVVAVLDAIEPPRVGR